MNVEVLPVLSAPVFPPILVGGGVSLCLSGLFGLCGQFPELPVFHGPHEEDDGFLCRHIHVYVVDI
jgi:hypothetical protein